MPQRDDFAAEGVLPRREGFSPPTDPLGPLRFSEESLDGNQVPDLKKTHLHSHFHLASHHSPKPGTNSFTNVGTDQDTAVVWVMVSWSGYGRGMGDGVVVRIRPWYG
ncbi:hypothetical protein Bbelb_291400 [Branchiostoma belcheri]|nr:hypothetical protein Bbelb_291400 [Branchiostoma belcheri]